VIALRQSPTAQTLLLGIGNSLLQDDGAGIHVIEALRDSAALAPSIRLRDGGTIGLALLADIEDCTALIAVDAMELGEAPGTVQTFTGPAMDAQLGGKKRTAHEVALADLLQAAELIGAKPVRRALVGIQPQSTEWGLLPTDPVQAAIPAACAAITSLLAEWQHDA
jgi:hydrogenase maturation protease